MRILTLYTPNPMKTLKENIVEILSSTKSINTKRNELKKLCLTPADISTIIFKYRVDHPEAFEPRPRIEAFKYRFGVELECLCNKSEVERHLNADGIAYEWAGCYYHTNNNRKFEFKSDSSIHSNSDTARGNNPSEMVSPVLDNDGFTVLKKACAALEATGAQVNKSTGFHVHVSSPTMTDTQYVNVFKNYQMLERVIDTFMARSRRDNNNTYCRSVLGYDFSGCHTPNDVKYVLYSRYHKVNACSWSSHKTIEFRQHQGTVNYTKVKHWVEFCAKLVGWSKDNVLTHEVASIDEIPFLTAREKAYYKGRVEALSNAAA